LQHLGYEAAGWGHSDRHGDWRGLTLDQLKTPYRFAVRMPYSIQINLVQPGQFLMGHPYEIRSIMDAKLLGLNKILLSVRDLRHVFMSVVRHSLYFYRLKILKEDISDTNIKSDQLLDFIKKSNGWVGQFGKACAELKNDPITRLVRYEELVSHDQTKMTSSLLSIADVADCSIDEVFEAVEKTEGQETVTFFKQHSRLKGVWNDEIEALFKSYGLDVLNEQLGYSRDYNPEDED
jgi:hypothetical protein